MVVVDVKKCLALAGFHNSHRKATGRDGGKLEWSGGCSGGELY